MRAAAGKNKKPALFSLVVVLISLLLVPAWAYADTFPFFIVNADTSPYGSGGVFAGGGYSSGPSTACNPLTDPGYGSPKYPDDLLTGNAKKGGILANGNNPQGSHSDLAAEGLGLIDTSGSNEDFSTGLSSGPSTVPYSLSFANTGDANYPAGFTSGLFTGGTGSASCIFDYYDAFKPASSTAGSSIFASAIPNGNTLYNGPLTINQTSATAFPTGRNSTVFVNGDLIISHDLTYSPGTDGAATKLAFVVKGNIYIAPAVANLYGLYIAQPTDPTSVAAVANSGYIYTCNTNANPPPAGPNGTYLTNNCRAGSALTVNGAFIAQQVVLDRVMGDITTTPAETFTFTSEMVLGGPFFNPGAGSTTATVDSLVSLPPVF